MRRYESFVCVDGVLLRRGTQRRREFYKGGNLSWGLDRMSDPVSSRREQFPRAFPLGRLDSRVSDGLCSK